MAICCCLWTHNSSTVLADPNYVDTASEMREITLAGDTVKSLTVTQLNASLQTAGADFQIGGFSHDVLPLANGHFLVLGTVTQAGDPERGNDANRGAGRCRD